MGASWPRRDIGHAGDAQGGRGAHPCRHRLLLLALRPTLADARVARQLDKSNAEITRMVGFTRVSDPGAVEAIAVELNRAIKERGDLQAQLDAFKTKSAMPRLPSPDEIAKLATGVEARIKQDPVVAREMLRRMLKGGALRMVPRPDGSYRAESVILPLDLPAKAKRPGVTGPLGDREISMVARACNSTFLLSNFKDLRRCGCRSRRRS